MTKGILGEPVRIGNLTIPNRWVMAPMGTGFADTKGYVTDRLVDYYLARTKGTGLIIVEGAVVSPEGQTVFNQLCAYDDSYLPGLTKLATAIKGAGTRCALQIQHAGRMAKAAVTGTTAIAPSPIASVGSPVPKEMTIEDIQKLADAYAATAERSKKAGFEGVDFHFTHGYVVEQFLSPLTNKRQDQYGGTLENRARFAVDIVRRTRERVGKDFPLIARITGDEYIKGGIGVRDAAEIAAILERAGVDAIDVSAGYRPSSEEGFIGALVVASGLPMPFPRGFYASLAEGVKKAVKVPVIAVGRLNNPEIAEQVVVRGQADLIAVGRQYLADPEFAAKISEGRFEDVRQCVACNSCYAVMYLKGDARCSVNAALGKERACEIKVADKPRKVLVVGGGVAGMEAARVAALRGHKVTLTERDSQLGGNVNTAAVAHFKRDLGLTVSFLSRQLGKLGVDVRLRQEATPDSIKAGGFDAVVLATGAEPVIPSIKGSTGENVTDAIRVLREQTRVGRRAVVVGGGMIGCEVASHLAESGRKVTLVSRRNTDYGAGTGLAPDMETTFRKWFLFEWWPKFDIRLVGNATYDEVVEGGLMIKDNLSGARQLVEADTVVFAVGLQPDTRLASALKGKVANLFEAGDCIKPRQIIDAIQEGAEAARRI